MSPRRIGRVMSSTTTGHCSSSAMHRLGIFLAQARDPRRRRSSGPPRQYRAPVIAEEIAQTIAIALEEQWPSSSTTSHARFDVATLRSGPTRTSVGAIQSALERRDIDFTVAETTLVYAADEVRELLGSFGRSTRPQMSETSSGASGIVLRL